ncbi:MAG: helix-turn-helix domain-containing protein [Pseudomonadales bacterium]|nr:helix-turn-helix domain-containing protein [Pseudomonadales bacterium]
MDRQSHDDCLIMYCTYGMGTLVAQDREFPITEGDLVALPLGLRHSYYADHQQPWSMYWAHFNGTSAVSYLTNLLSNKEFSPVVSPGMDPKLIADFEQLLSVQQTGYQFSHLLYASNLLAQWLSYAAVKTQLSEQQTGKPIDLENIRQFMSANLSAHLDLDTLAAKAHLSKYHFSKKYKDLTGYSPIQHFLHLKVEHACYLLDSTSQPISRIGTSLGYDDPQYFSRMFKQIIGISPKKYRELQRG